MNKKNFLVTIWIVTISFHLSIKAQEFPSKTNIEKAMIKALEWQEQHPIYALAPTDWTNGAYYIGVTKAHQATNNQKHLLY